MGAIVMEGRSGTRGVALLALAVAACGTEDAGTLVFAERTDAEIQRLIAATAGFDVLAAQAQTDRFRAATSCPAVSVVGPIVTLTGGCTTADGIAVEGTAHVTNPRGWPQVQHDPTYHTTYELDGWSITHPTFAWSADGVIMNDGAAGLDADVTTIAAGVTIHSVVHYSCDGSTCDLDGGSVELVGVGTAQVSGQIDVAARALRFTVRGEDTLFGHAEGGCTAWEITGSDRAQPCGAP